MSSTYADLKDERQHVIQALMEMDCIPAGMELFPAADEEQWDFIKRVVNDCDYYLLIIGGRYGSVTPDGISYTEKEYDYAVSRGLKVVALLHESPNDIPVGKSEIDPAARAKLASFRDKVASGRLVKFWRTAEDLPGLVSLSLSKTIKMYPTVGWVRANAVGSAELLSEINELRKENAALLLAAKAVHANREEAVPDLASLDATFDVRGTYISAHGQRPWHCTIAWRDLFAAISPYLQQYPYEPRVKEVMISALTQKIAETGSHFIINDQDFQTIALQFRALGLTNAIRKDMSYAWSLTPAGERLMLMLRTVRSVQPTAAQNGTG